ncbi:hypothetical protein FBZ93_105245 [Bradyrhizobium macuxiense]|uniref:Uncharacterized protein n=1 Tax=Bradyrhizobium macuxiense TaxID=1755647 RepID=A0A560LYB9_9BRAD|nr:hypothetical protein FBZ93_105245 [Bradyrhizobium macuxiense]
MCDKCAQLDEKIAHIRMLASQIVDQFTLDAIAALVEDYETQKRDLHPEPKE